MIVAVTAQLNIPQPVRNMMPCSRIVGDVFTDELLFRMTLGCRIVSRLHCLFLVPAVFAMKLSLRYVCIALSIVCFFVN